MEKKNIGFDSSIEFSKTSKGKIYWNSIKVSPINFNQMEESIDLANVLEEEKNQSFLNSVDRPPSEGRTSKEGLDGASRSTPSKSPGRNKE